MNGNCIGCKLKKEISKTGQRDGKLFGICIECKLFNQIEGIKI